MVRPRVVSDEEILQAARAGFLAHGPALSTAVIADSLGVSQATLFKRFGSKERLMVAALTPRLDGPEWASVIAPLDERPFVDQLTERGLIVLRFFDQMMPCVAMLHAHSPERVGELMARPDAPPVRAHAAVRALFDAAVAAGRVAPCDTEALAMVWLGALRQRAFWSANLPGAVLRADGDEYVRTLNLLLWRGLRPGGHP